MEECRLNSEGPLMYSHFSYYIQQEQKRRATMHINRKPEEQVEVDWAEIRQISLILILAKLSMSKYSSVL